MMSSVETMTEYKGTIVGVGICPKCMVINKVRSNEPITNNVCKCHSCGAEITVKKMKSY